MTLETKLMDRVNWQILELLQKDARLPFSELGREVGLSAPAVAERVRRMEDAGVITGYKAVIDPKCLGYSLEVFIRLSVSGATHGAMERWVQGFPNVLDCWNLTGDDCYILRVVVREVRELESLLRSLNTFGKTTTSLTLSQPIQSRAITADTDVSKADSR